MSRSVGWIVDRGSDFPEGVTRLIDTWSTAAVVRTDESRLTTRGWNSYDGVENRAFRYTTPKKRLEAADLTPALLASKTFHILSSPSRCRDIVTELTARRKEAMGDSYYRAAIIWEPVPDRCTADELLNCTNTLPIVDVCSPNHAELAGFMGDPHRGLDPATGAVSVAAVERACEQLLGSMPLQSYTFVIRAGEAGCYVARNGGRRRPAATGAAGAAGGKRRKKDYVRGGLQPDTDMEALFAGLLQDDEGAIAREEIDVDPGIDRWFPAYHRGGGGVGGPGAASKVVDPTGGGNAFLGGLAVALARGKAVEEAAVWGSVAASFAIEQVGVPALGRDEDGNETWNGVRVENRLREFQTRLGMS